MCDYFVIPFHVVSSVFNYGKIENHSLYWVIYERDLYREKAFFTLLDGIIKYVRTKMEPDTPVKWMDKKEAMQVLRIKSPTTLQKLRNEGKIRFSQPEKKHIVYDRDSINDYL